MSPARRTAFRILLFGLLGLSAYVFFSGLDELAARGFPFWPRRYLTLTACIVLAAASAGALANKTWGVLLAVVCAVTFGGVVLYGIAPPLFLAVTAGGLAAFALVAPDLRQREPTAFWMASTTVVLGGAAAVAIAGPGVRALF